MSGFNFNDVLSWQKDLADYTRSRAERDEIRKLADEKYAEYKQFMEQVKIMDEYLEPLEQKLGERAIEAGGKLAIRGVCNFTAKMEEKIKVTDPQKTTEFCIQDERFHSALKPNESEMKKLIKELGVMPEGVEKVNEMTTRFTRDKMVREQGLGD